MRPKFSLRFLLLGTACIAFAISLGQFLALTGTLAIPVAAFASLLCLGPLLLKRDHKVARLLLPCVVSIQLAFVFLVLSLGPICSAMVHFRVDEKTSPSTTNVFRFVYHPISNAYCFAPEPVRSIGMRYLAFWFPKDTTLKDAGFRIQWKTETGWQFVKASRTKTFTDEWREVLARTDNSLSVPRGA